MTLLDRCSHEKLRRQCTTFGKLAMEIRLSLAARRLSLGKERISDIAYSCRFASLPHFSRNFRTRFDIAPSAYRAHLQDQAGRASS
ncbi:helix-turn-helix domain-containing protein [Bradyrhizobium elkanii]